MSTKVLYASLFALLLVLSVHSFTSVGQDIGRHIKTGEIIWDSKEIPKTNLYSYTEPGHKFINHHWLSEVVLFLVYNFSGFLGLIIFKTALIFLSYWLLFNSIKEKKIWPLAASFLLSIFIFIERTEVRPEIFSFLILSFYLFSIFKAKYEGNLKYLWFLPLAQLFWVNLHIYFFIGPFLLLVFVVDNFINKSVNSKKLLIILTLAGLATLINPNGLEGAIIPFKILKEYGYSIVENKDIFFLAKYFDFNISIFTFKLSAVLLSICLVCKWRKSREYIFEMIVSGFLAYAGFRMLRNLPLFALGLFPILSIIFPDIKIKGFILGNKVLKMALVSFLVILIVLVIQNRFYELTYSPKMFGFSVPNGLDRGINFIKENKIKGPLFNNFDIGGFLIWKLYPGERVFVDNRPEAYSTGFFNDIYKPMQGDKQKWGEFSKKHNINYIFFAHTDVTPWAKQFVQDIIKSNDWKLVYLNENILIFVKNSKDNSNVISKFNITNKNAESAIRGSIKDSNMKEIDLKLIMARIAYDLRWQDAASKLSDEVLKIDHDNAQAYIINGLAHAYYTDDENQALAAENIKKAIDLGLKKSEYYTILGIVYMNLGRLQSAELMFKEALKVNKNNEQAKEFLGKYFSK